MSYLAIPIGLLIFGTLFGNVFTVQEYRYCDESFSCTTYCLRFGFDMAVCKKVTVDSSTKIDGTQLENRKICLCSNADELFRYFFSPGHECVRNGNDAQCKDFCTRVDIDPDLCKCQLSSCSFPKTHVKPTKVGIKDREEGSSRPYPILPGYPPQASGIVAGSSSSAGAAGLQQPGA